MIDLFVDRWQVAKFKILLYFYDFAILSLIISDETGDKKYEKISTSLAISLVKGYLKFSARMQY